MDRLFIDISNKYPIFNRFIFKIDRNQFSRIL